MIKSDPKLKRSYEGNVVWSMLMMPGHRVRLTKPFYMGATEVTVGEYRKFADSSGYKTEAEQGLNGGQPYKGKQPISTWRKPMAWRKDYKQKEDEPVLHLCYNDCVAATIDALRNRFGFRHQGPRRGRGSGVSRSLTIFLGAVRPSSLPW